MIGKIEKIGLIGAVLFALLLLPVVSAQPVVGQASVTFSVSGFSCDQNATAAAWVNGSVRLDVSDPSIRCDQYSADIGGQSCCPGIQVCNAGAGGDGTCGPQSAGFCWQYLDQSTCETALVGVGESSVIDDSGNPLVCTHTPSDYCDGVELTGCNCRWDSAAGQCLSNTNVTVFCESGETFDRGSCSWQVLSIQNNCNTTLNNIILSKISEWASAGTGAPLVLNDGTTVPAGYFIDGPDWCNDAERTYQCPSAVRLPFFTAFNFIIAIALLIGIYTFYICKKQ